MPDFHKSFLHQDRLDLARDSTPVVRLAAFGKHPAWNDHMEDIGLDTLALVEAKRYLYVQGISGQIDSGAWGSPSPSSLRLSGSPLPFTESLGGGGGQGNAPPPADPALAQQRPIENRESKIENFNHWLLWHRPGEILLGRLLASIDGKGRSRYPLVVLAHIINLPLAPAIDTCARLLDAAAGSARSATSPDSVRRVISETRERLFNLALYAPDTPSPLPPGLRLQLSPGAWTRIYNAIESHLSQFAPGASPDASTPCRHLRLPAAGADPLQSLLWWNTYLLTQLSPLTPLLLIAPAADAGLSPADSPPSEIHSPYSAFSHLDLIAGEPASHHFRCLLVPQSALPLVTDIPYDPAPRIIDITNEHIQNPDPAGLPPRSLFRPKPPTRESALATVASRDGLARAIRPPGFLHKIFG